MTAKELRQHNTREDAWTVLRGKVYDIGPYMLYHPGGRGNTEDASSLIVVVVSVV